MRAREARPVGGAAARRVRGARPRIPSSSRCARRCGASTSPSRCCSTCSPRSARTRSSSATRRWDELLDYCRRSANPVGRLVLLVFEQGDPGLPPLSDAICTGLQLANHWQDLAVDLRRGRLYVPRELLRALRREGVGAATPARVTPGSARLMTELLARTRELFRRGRPLCDRVGRELRFEMRLTWLGGSAILDRIEAAGLRRVPPAAPARPARQAAPGLARLALAARARRRGGLSRAARLGPHHAPERHQLLLRLPHPARGQAPRHLRALLLLPGGGRLRGRGGRGGRGRAAAVAGGGAPLLRRASPRRDAGPGAGGGALPVPDPARLLRGDRGGLPHGPDDRRATPTLRRPARSTASGWPPRWGWPPSRSSSYRHPRTRAYAVELGRGPAAHEHPARRRARTPRAAASTCRSRTCARFGVGEAELLAERAPGGARRPGLRAAAAVPGRARPRAVRARARALLPAVDRRGHGPGRDHGRGLSPRARALAPARLPVPARASRLSRPRRAWIAAAHAASAVAPRA